MPVKPLPSTKYLRECFDYNPKTGVLRWRARPRVHFKSHRDCDAWNTRFASTVSGTITTKGYYAVVIKGRPYLLSRIIWKLVTNNDPLNTIDHADRNPKNNRWSNLRQATNSEQMYNTKVFKNNRTGIRGAYLTGRYWIARIRFNKTSYYLGYYSTAEEAGKAYRIAAHKLHKRFSWDYRAKK